MTDTIVALSSGAGRSAIAVLRLSGPGSGSALDALTGGRLPPARRASLRRLRDPATDETLDEAVVLWWPGPGSYTGEDTGELHLHGGIAVRTAVLRALTTLGCRPAEPGEFTRRAFVNGRMDLTEAEGVADLIDAETDAQRRQALRQTGGALSTALEGWRSALIGTLALCEASLDFVDEEDVPDAVTDTIAAEIDGIAREIDGAIAGAQRGERLREGLVVVIAGPPNAGKSTLLNAIARREVAIVSAIPGTTRDAIEVRCDLGGMPVTFVDTAGLRATADALEREGIARTERHLAGADLVLWLHPSDERASDTDAMASAALSLRIATKADLGLPDAGADLAISAATGAGLPELLARVEEVAIDLAGRGDDAVLTRERHRLILRDASVALRRARAAVADTALELVAADIRAALAAIGRVTGQVDTEEVLDRIFAQFCIGK